jgi:serine/threonine protein kinase
LRSDDRFAAVPLIFLTGLEERVNYRRAMRLGADDFITKPFDIDDLLEAVEVRFKRVDSMRRQLSAHHAGTSFAALPPNSSQSQPAGAANDGTAALATSHPQSKTNSSAAHAISHLLSRTLPSNPGALRPSQAHEPVKIDGYRLIEKIGQGGTAQAFLAQSSAGGPLQVLKIFEIGSSGDGDQLRRFLHEYEVIAEVKHPSVARIYSQGFSGIYAYIGMEYFPGGDLRRLIKAGLDAPVALDFLRQIAQALKAIHALGIVHRDLKPDNLMLRVDGSLALADFGIAKRQDMQMTRTANGDVVGTPFYLSPEQALGESIDYRSDYYSLGVIFYELLVGDKPYRARTTKELFDLHAHAPVPQLPEHLAQYQLLLDGLMAKRREQRFASVNELLWALKACTATMPAESKPAQAAVAA